MARILIVDDHWLVASALEREVRQLRPDAEFAGARSVADAVKLLHGGELFDLILLDLKLPDAQGLDALDALLLARPDAKIAIVSAYEDPKLIREAYRRGAIGYLPKTANFESFEEALRLLLSGGFFFPTDALEPPRVFSRFGLTPREGEVLDQLILGLTSKQIARELALAPATVNKHVEQIRIKLGARSRMQLLARLGDLVPEAKRE